MLDGIISGGLNLLGGWMQNKANAQNAKDAQAFEQKMWEQSNEYNSPLNQMQRLKDAGLNPNLVYGSGSVAGNTATASQPRSHVPEVQNILSKMDSINPLTMLGQYQDIKYKQLTNDLTGELIKNKQQERIGKILENEWLDKTFVDRHTKLANEKLSAEAKGQTDWRLFKENALYDTYMIEQSTKELNRRNLEMDVELNEALKPWGFTTRDDVRVRAAAVLSEKFGKKLRKIW